ncbi:T9SS-dependent choice-of-anchor J family protein [Lentimicrobium sp. S6]|uniref:T9SS-dependent choice-of-anchor J family protein n=1 Tax=Lentimicrobium sp. S6 TaxID=2735872 RepID=UPI0015523010|nr:choice-of-anchor J domain-containing protein [Lentimicrobium sp. S6]NPD45719.1 T9SS type A sorting domain-containing protein [Lentimicrobium sp. S6]
MKKLFLIALLVYSTLTFSQFVFNEGFENNNSNENPPSGWTCDADGWLAGNGVQNHGREARTGDWFGYLKWGSDHWMYKEIELESGETYEFSMFYQTDNSEGFSLEVMWGNEANSAAMNNEIFPLQAVNEEFYTEYSMTFVANETGTFFLGIHGVADNSPWYLVLDDIYLRKIEDYEFNITRLNADTLIQAGSHHDYLLEIENFGLYADDLSLTYDSEWPATFYAEDGSTSISNLQLEAFESKTIILRQSVPSTGVENEQEEVTMVTLNSTNSSVSHSTQISSMALTPISEFPVIADFELELFPPLGWTANIGVGDKNFVRSTEGVSPACLPHDDSQGMAYYNAYSSDEGNTAYLISPELIFQEEEYIVRFWMYRSDHIDNKADKIEVYISDDANQSNAQLLGTIHRTISMTPVETYEGWFEYSFTFDGTADLHYVSLKAVSAYGWNLFVDDIKIQANTLDEEAPEFLSVNEMHQYADLEIPVSVTIRDDSEVTETMQGIYNVGNGDESFELTLNSKSKANYIYSGNIPAHIDGTEGTVYFVMEDIVGNTANSASFDISWQGVAPLLEESFEGDFLPEGWDQIMAQFTWFVWYQEPVVEYVDSDGVEYTVTPPDGDRQAVVQWDWQNNAQDEWLISPPFEVTAPAELSFETFAQLGSYDYDHFIVAISTDYGISWTDEWDAFFMDNRVIAYDETIRISLDDYEGETIRIAWRAYNQSYDNLWYSWFVDDIKVEKREETAVLELSNHDTFTFKLMENPSSEHLKIQLRSSEVGQAEIHLYNLQGSLVKSETLQVQNTGKNQASYAIEGLEVGVYFCEVILNGDRNTEKFLIAK